MHISDEGSNTAPLMGLLTICNLSRIDAAELYSEKSLRLMSSASYMMKELSAWVTTKAPVLLGWKAREVTGEESRGRRQCNRSLNVMEIRLWW